MRVGFTIQEWLDGEANDIDIVSRVFGMFEDQPEARVTIEIDGVPDTGEEGETNDLLDNILNAVRSTPQKDVSYFCHGEPHFDTATDYDTIRKKIEAILITNKLLKGDEDSE